MNDLIFHYALFFHIVNGTVALLIAPLAMVTVKGGLWHRRWGKIYFWAMAGVAISATVMCPSIRSGMFLFLVAIFSFYFALTGYTVLRRKKPEDGPGLLDWCAAISMLLAGIAFVTTGALDANLGAERWLRLAFGSGGLLLGGLDIRRFFKPHQSKRAWMYVHMGRFLAGYIATVTAFSVVNFQFLPQFLRWFLPTAVGVPLIIIWQSYYKRKFKREASAQAAPSVAVNQP
ncbi:MAG TPA: DUF2306 domain-containing protein [Candidatus Sulfotelmatobacter sp.]|nr:DUF2306 domain-containing protein [Candidatus Sulfotelmatobacter sp.]